MAEKVLKCSFCGKTHQQVIKLIAGPGVYICNQCVDLCAEIIEQEEGDQPPKRVLDAEIEAAAQAARDAVDRLQKLAERARAVPEGEEPEEPTE